MDMNASKNNTVRGLWDELNQGIFPWVDDNIGELDGKHRLFMAVCEAVITPPPASSTTRSGRESDARRPAA